MIRVRRKTGVSSDTRSGVSTEVYKVAFGVLIAVALIVGVVAFASLGVGLTKAILMILGV